MQSVGFFFGVAAAYQASLNFVADYAWKRFNRFMRTIRKDWPAD